MPVLDKALKFRWLTLSVFLSALLLSFSLVAFGAIRFVFFPSVPSDYIFLELKMAEGTPIQETSKAINRIDNAIEEIAEELHSIQAVTSALLSWSCPRPRYAIPMPMRSLAYGEKKWERFLGLEN